MLVKISNENGESVRGELLGEGKRIGLEMVSWPALGQWLPKGGELVGIKLLNFDSKARHVFSPTVCATCSSNLFSPSPD